MPTEQDIKLVAEFMGFTLPGKCGIPHMRNGRIMQRVQTWIEDECGRRVEVLPPYSTSLDAQASVVNKICETENGKRLLDFLLKQAGDKVGKTSNTWNYRSTWQACLTAQERFPIIVEAIKRLKGVDNG